MTIENIFTTTRASKVPGPSPSAAKTLLPNNGLHPMTAANGPFKNQYPARYATCGQHGHAVAQRLRQAFMSHCTNYRVSVAAVA